MLFRLYRLIFWVRQSLSLFAVQSAGVDQTLWTVWGSNHNWLFATRAALFIQIFTIEIPSPIGLSFSHRVEGYFGCIHICMIWLQYWSSPNMDASGLPPFKARTAFQFFIALYLNSHTTWQLLILFNDSRIRSIPYLGDLIALFNFCCNDIIAMMHTSLVIRTMISSQWCIHL